MIILTTLNSRYAHTSFGLKYLQANLHEYAELCRIKEHTIKSKPDDVIADLLSTNPKLIGFGLYIWNIEQSLILIKKMKELRPDLMIVAGGPEISHESESHPVFDLLDYIFKGEADFLFYEFIKKWQTMGVLPDTKIIGPHLPEIKQIHLPYRLYTDEDIRHRTIYVEASRGCPYKCEYCLSSLDVSVRSFELDQFLFEMQLLIDRGARQFKFVDRTFNLSATASTRILKFFLDQIHLGLFLHFEMVPDRLPDELKILIEKFPAGSLQFEIGIQTWNPEVARNVSRRQNYEKIIDNFHFLKQKTSVHTHADLIFGLPGETLESFAAGFNSLARLEPDEIQVGRLKRLKGTPINRHTEKFQMHYHPVAPYQILENKNLTMGQVDHLQVFADFWGHIANSGRYADLMAEFKKQNQLFEHFNLLAQALYAKTQRSHSIHLSELDDLIEDYLKTHFQESAPESSKRSAYLQALAQDKTRRQEAQKNAERASAAPKRQRAHLQTKLPKT